MIIYEAMTGCLGGRHIIVDVGDKCSKVRIKVSGGGQTGTAQFFISKKGLSELVVELQDFLNRYPEELTEEKTQ